MRDQAFHKEQDVRAAEVQPVKKTPAPAPDHRAPRLQAMDVQGVSPAVPFDPTDPNTDDAARMQSAELSGVAPTDLSRDAGAPDEAGREAAPVEEVVPQPSGASATRADQRRTESKQEEARQRHTMALVGRLAAALAIDPAGVDVHADESGQERARGAGTRGLVDGRHVFLDSSRFDPQSPDGQRLVGHEMMHVAQQRLAPADHADPAGLAEAEAHLGGESFARTGAMLRPRVGLPRGHVAHENGAGSGGNLSGLIEQYRGFTEQSAATVPETAAPPGGGIDPTATQDRESKVSQYEDGVDGIADLIGDLDAFDALCEAIDDEEDTAGPLGQVKSSDHYRQLCRMWQGAKEGGEDAGRMQGIFNNEFNGRGFWGETEAAFDMVCSNAKADAAPEPTAEAARGEITAAEEAVTENTAAMDEAGIDAGGGNGPVQAPAPVDPRLAAFLGATVPEQAPRIPSFDQMSQITDAQFDAVSTQAAHHNSFSERAASGEFGSRTEQIFETLGENLLGGAVRGGTDQLVDSLLWDNIGFLGDQGLKLATGGRLATPMVGALIGLAQNPPWTAAAWGGEQFGSSFESFGRLDDTLAQFANAEDVGDYVGIFCAALADFFGGLRDLLDALATICGTLSALCYVVGGVLILVGIALLWLAGIGAPLVTAGGWLTRAGSILGRINTALAGVVIVLGLVTTFFRTIAAFLVPASMYAGQLTGVGQAADKFGEKAAAKAVDTGAEGLNARVRGPIQSRVDGRIPPPGGPRDGGGGADADQVRDAIDRHAQAVADRQAAQQQQNADGTRPPQTDPNRPPQDGSDQQPPRDGDDQRPRDGDDQPPRDGDAAPRSRLRRIVGLFERAPLLGPFVTEAADIVENGRRAAMEGLSPTQRDILSRRMDGQITDARQKVTDLRRQLAGMDGDVDPADKARVESEVTRAEGEVRRLQQRFDETRRAITETEAAEELARRDRDGRGDSPLDAEVQRRQEAVDALKRQLDDARRELETARPDAQTRIADLQRRIADAEAAEQTARDTHAREKGVGDAQNEQRRQAAIDESNRLLSDMERLTREADALEGRATDAVRAQQLRADAERLRNEADSARQTADQQRAQMERFVGQRIKVNDPQATSRDGVSERKLLRIEGDMIVIAEGRNQTERRLPLSSVRYPAPLRDLAADSTEAQQRAQQLQGESDQARGQADGLAPPGTEPQALRDQATNKREEAAGLQGPHQDQQDQLRSGDLADRAQRERERAAESEANLQSETARGHQREINDLNSAVTERETRAAELQTQLQTSEQSLAQAEAARTAARPVGEHRDSVYGGSSGNATGGTGSSYKGWGEAFVRWTGLYDVLLEELAGAGADVSTLRAIPEDKANERTLGRLADVGSQHLLGIDRETEAELQAIGERRGAVERVLELGPPVDPATMSEKRVEAIAAHERYLVAHAKAYRAFLAEEAVTRMAAETEAMAAEGEPVCEAAQSMATPLQQSRTDEDQRQAIITGQAPQVQQGGGEGASSIVGELIMKLASHGDAMDDQPNPGSPDAGAQIDQGQQQASTETTARTGQTAQASASQRAFLDAAITERATREQQVSGDIQTLQQKHQQELAIKAEIQQVKAEALVEREQERATVEENASGFNADFARMETWRQQYETRRQGLGQGQ